MTAKDLILAFDFGLKRIGIASGNLLTRTATPLVTLQVHGTPPWPDIDRVIADWQPSVLVVGLPKAGGTSSIHDEVLAFAGALGERFGLSVATVDESLTSQAAASGIRDNRRSGYLRRRTGKGRLDRHAACLIAEQWMSEHP